MRPLQKYLWLAFLLGLTTVAGSSGCHMLNRIVRIPQKTPAKKTTKKGDAKEKKEYTLRVPPYVFITDFPINRKLPLFRDLTELRQHVARELELPDADNLIKVYLFKTKENYRAYIKETYPDLPHRRAFFVAQPRGPYGHDELMVYTWWGDEIEKDLHHELTHALLHSVLQDVPLWLDEGLAEYFETGKKSHGMHEHHLKQLQSAAKAFQPNMERLEKMTEMKDMTTAEYREAWAWVHFMLHGNPSAKRVLLDYLRELRTNGNPGRLGPRLQTAVGDMDQALLDHLRRLQPTVTWISARSR